MNIFETYEHLIRVELERMVSAGNLAPADFSRVTVEPVREAAHGDLTTNAALIASGKADKESLAQILARHFVSLHDVITAKAAENGLINLRIKPIVWHRVVSGILHGSRGKDPCTGISYDTAADLTISDPVFSIQHTRTLCCTVLRQAKTVLARDLSDNALAAVSLAGLSGESDLALMRKLAGWHHAQGSAAARPQKVYAQELAAAFRAFCADQTGNAALGFVSTKSFDLSLARLALVRSVAIVLEEFAA